MFASEVPLCQACGVTWDAIPNSSVAVEIKDLRAILLDLQCRKVESTCKDSTVEWVNNTATLAVEDSIDFTNKHLSMLL